MIKKFSSTFAVLLLAVSFALPPTTANAQSNNASCEIRGTTGPGSNNTCTVNSGDTCKVQNNTIVNIGNQNVQNAQSGQGIVYQNTSGGNATSGNASNSNTTVVSGTINNSGDCVVVVEEEPETPVVPETPAGGAGQTLGTAATPKVLPATGTESSLIGIGLSAAVLAYITGVRLGRTAQQ